LSPAEGRSLHCGKVSLESLARRYGTPLFVYSADQIVERLGLFQAAFRGREHLVCYAVKANSTLAILKLLDAHGAGFDIVSGGEFQRILVAAPDAVDRVVFSGVGKTTAEIDLALEAGILQFNVESEAELQMLAARSRKLKRTARFALRVNPDVFADTIPTSRLACASTNSVSTSARRGASTSALPATAGSGLRRQRAHRFADSFRRAFRSGHGSRHAACHATRERWHRAASHRRWRRTGHRLSRRNLDAAAKVNEYASAIEKSLHGFEGRLLMEPGRFLVAHAGALLTRVLQVNGMARRLSSLPMPR